MRLVWLRNVIRNDLAGVDKYRYGKPVSELQRELDLERVVRLSSNENPWPLPGSVLNAIQTSLENYEPLSRPPIPQTQEASCQNGEFRRGVVIIGAGTEGILPLPLSIR
jgi:histidinol-phosphate aminotransferase